MLHRLSCSILGMHGGIYCGDIKTFKHIPLCISFRFLTYEFFGLEGSGPSSGTSASYLYIYKEEYLSVCSLCIQSL